MTPNETYLARTTFSTYDDAGEEVEFISGILWKSISFDTLFSAATGHQVKLPLHIARNPEWYFHRVGDMGVMAIGPKVSQAEYTRELVRANEGLDFECLWDIGAKEGWLPCQTVPASKNVFSACLSSDDKIQVYYRNLPVMGTAKERGHIKGYTYHMKRKAA